MKKIILIFVLLISAAVLSGHDYVPGEIQTHPILLRGGDLYTVSDGIMPQTDILFDSGRIAAIGKNLEITPETEVIDVTGMQVYPGLIAATSTLGLIEIGAVRATDDQTEVGQIHPEVQAYIAYNTDSEVIPSTRSNGITTALVVPLGGMISGRSALMNLNGWTYNDAAEKFNVGMHVVWPQTGIIKEWWMNQTPEEQKKNNARNLKILKEAFDDARAWYTAQLADPGLDKDIRWEAMKPLFTGEMPLFVEANEYGQIEQAVNFCLENNFRLVIVGGADSWLLTDLLAQNDIPVIVTTVHQTPRHEDADYDLQDKLPFLLKQAGVDFCLAPGAGATPVRNLAFLGAQAAAFGLDKETALRSVTLSPAEILGVADNLGSLQVGKKATIVVSRGDIMDPMTCNVIYEFIEGRKVDLDDRHKELYRKYRLRN